MIAAYTYKLVHEIAFVIEVDCYLDIRQHRNVVYKDDVNVAVDKV